MTTYRMMSPPPDNSVAAIGARSLAAALNDVPMVVYIEVAKLGDWDLARLAKAAGLVCQAAKDQLDSGGQQSL